ncbi:MAG: acyl-CoA thioesterase [Candidatus Wallbacteria bacterium]|nr:acyl-CoA thioesterase [Candidatus Wallbacteria bacterium]
MTHFPVSVLEKVRFADLDSFGHLNNSVYFTFFEQARIAYMKALDMLDGAGPKGSSFILLETRCRFLKPCFMDDELLAQARVSRLGDSSAEMEYRILRGEEAVAEGSGVVVYYDYATSRKATIPAAMREKVAAIEGQQP